MNDHMRSFPFDPLRLRGEVAIEAATQQGFVISPDVPLPGSYTFRRVIKLDVRSLSGRTLMLKADADVDVAMIATKKNDGTLELKKQNIGAACDFWAKQALAARFPAAGVARSVHAAKLGADVATDRPDIDGVLRSFLSALDRNEIELPVLTPSGHAGSKLYYAGGRFGGVGAGFYAVEEYRVSAFLTRFGLGRTIATFSLLPGEETTIKARSWRSMQKSTESTSATETIATTSIVDSVDERSIDRFSNELQSATGDKSSNSSEERWHVNGEVGGTVGFAHAKVEAGGGGDYRSAQEDFANQATKAVKEHTDEASRNRRNTVENVGRTSQSVTDRTQVSTEEENVVERRLKNINLRRVLNYVFRELNQEYDVVVHLVNVRFAYSSGVPGSWREVPPSKLQPLIEEVCEVNSERGSTGIVDHEKPFTSEVTAAILDPVSRALDIYGKYPDTMECVVQSADKTEVTTLRDDQGLMLPGDDVRLDRDVGAIRAGESVKIYPRFKIGPLTKAEPAGTRPLPRIDGVVVGRTTSVLRTDSIVVEALLGFSDALDPFAFRSQELSTDASAATVKLQSLEADRISLALESLEMLDDPKARADAFAKFFPPAPTPPKNGET